MSHGTVQTRDSWDTSFASTFQKYLPLQPDIMIYNIIREAIPLADAIVRKRARLLGDFRYDALGNDGVQKFLDEFYRNIRVGQFGKGFRNYQNQVLDSVLCNGFSVSEIVPNQGMNGINHLKVGKALQFRFIRNEDKTLELCQLVDSNFQPLRLANQDLIKYVAFDLRDGHPQGRSIFSSCPFVAEVISRIIKSIDNVVWRFGDPTLVLIYGAGEGEETESVHEAIDIYLAKIKAVMLNRKSGGSGDVGMSHAKGGSISLQLLGGDSKFKLIDVEMPMRMMMEQLISVSDIPPSLFGLSWSTTERMSKDQIEMLVAQLESERTMFDATIEEITDMALIMNGMAGAKWKHVWYPINLSDEVSTASARLTTAQAIEKEIQNLFQARDAGFIGDENILEFFVSSGIITAKEIKQTGKELVLKNAHEHANRRQIMSMARLINE